MSGFSIGFKPVEFSEDKDTLSKQEAKLRK